VLTRDRDLPERPIPHWQVGVLVVVGVALPVVGGVSWLTVTGIVAACFAAFLPRWAAVVGVLAAGLFGGVFARAMGADDGAALIYALRAAGGGWVRVRQRPPGRADPAAPRHPAGAGCSGTACR